ncbi:anti-sigma factor [Frigidibacter sp. RF13]|uniref:anti-sigma factor n=1 Tax=Frigidibacter sp. RF13 TaxID=2997340 RepID=UPI002272216C|nr:anti-sigma factor [Frigidibacter sp. RF13]MCY1125569.1 anti-sigma factor [Frigidibacter sp. RF13]
MTEGRDMDDRDGLAAEYVLGTLPLPDRLEAERLIASDPDFATLVARWQAHLAPLDAGYMPVEPPSDLQARIEARLFPTAPAAPRWRLPLFGALAAGLLAMLIAVFMPAIQPQATLTATLTGENQPLTVAAAFYEDRGELSFVRTAGPAAAEGQDYELWIIPEGQGAISLGVLRDGELRVPVEDLPAGTTLAVTLETKGGSPTGVAQGPLLVAAVIGKG